MLLDHNAPLKAWTQAWTELEKAPDKHFLLVLASRDIVDWWTNARDAVALDYLDRGWKWSHSLGRCTTPQGGWLKIVPADTSLEKLRGLRFHAIHTFGVHDLDTIGFLRGRLHPLPKRLGSRPPRGVRYANRPLRGCDRTCSRTRESLARGWRQQGRRCSVSWTTTTVTTPSPTATP